MSSITSPTANINRTVDNFNGGNPGRNDLAPAIVFAVVLGLTIPLLIWRLVSSKHRNKVLANAVGFLLIRLASLILRAYMARRSYSAGTVVAQAILSSIAYLPLLNAAISLWKQHAEHEADHATMNEGNGINDEKKHYKKKAAMINVIGWALRFLLLVTLITAIAAAALLRSNYSTQEQASVIRNLLKASYVISLVVSILNLVLVAMRTIMNHDSLGKTALLYAYSVPLLIVSIYRVVEIFTDFQATRRQLIAFFVVMVLFEVVAYLILLAVSIPKWLAKYRDEYHNDDQEKRRLREEDAARKSQSGNNSPRVN